MIRLLESVWGVGSNGLSTAYRKPVGGKNKKMWIPVPVKHKHPAPLNNRGNVLQESLQTSGCNRVKCLPVGERISCLNYNYEKMVVCIDRDLGRRLHMRIEGSCAIQPQD